MNKELEKIFQHTPPNKLIDVIPCVLQGRNIHAIKNLRKVTGYGLKESKEIVDTLRFIGTFELTEAYNNLKETHPEYFL